VWAGLGKRSSLIRLRDRPNCNDIGISRRKRRRIPLLEAVPHRRNNDGTLCNGVRDSVPLNLRVNRAAQAEIKNSRAVIHCPPYARGDIGSRTDAAHVGGICIVDDARKHSNGHNVACPRDTSDTTVVVGRTSNGPGDVCAVTHLVLRVVVATHEIALEMKPRRRRGIWTEVD